MHKLGLYEESIEVHRKILKIDPGHVNSLINISASYFELGKYEEALKYTNKALKVEPYNKTALENKREIMKMI